MNTISQTWNIVKIAGLYCILAAAFSFSGIFIQERHELGNPTSLINLNEISGHILLGLVAGAVTLSFRYTILTGLFAILVDADHLIALTHLDALSRMSHSFAFAGIAITALMVSFGRKDYRLGAVVLAGVLSHMSFDIFAGDDSEFPLFAPFYNKQINFPHQDWIYFEVAAIMILGLVSFLQKKKQIQKTL